MENHEKFVDSFFEIHPKSSLTLNLFFLLVGEKIGEKLANFFGITDSLFEDEFYVYTRKNEIGGKYFWQNEASRKEWLQESRQCVLVQPSAEEMAFREAHDGEPLDEAPDIEENVTGTSGTPENEKEDTEEQKELIEAMQKSENQTPKTEDLLSAYDEAAIISTNFLRNSDNQDMNDDQNSQESANPTQLSLVIRPKDVKLKVGTVISPTKIKQHTPSTPINDQYSQLVDESFDA